MAFGAREGIRRVRGRGPALLLFSSFLLSRGSVVRAHPRSQSRMAYLSQTVLHYCLSIGRIGVCIPVSLYVEDLLNVLSPQVSPGTLSCYRLSFLKHIESMGDSEICSILPQNVELFENRAAVKMSSDGFNFFLCSVRHGTIETSCWLAGPNNKGACYGRT